MNCQWHDIVQHLGLSAVSEQDIHDHDPRERAHLFHNRDASGSTEYEFLNLIHALVMAMKPERAIETGTFTGMGTLAIAHAMSWNGIGQLTTVDCDPCLEAKAQIDRYALTHLVNFIKSDALEFINAYAGEPFDMAFIDSGDGRLVETNALVERGKLSDRALVILHDASPHRVGSEQSWDLIFANGCPLHGFTISSSRGLRLMWAKP